MSTQKLQLLCCIQDMISELALTVRSENIISHGLLQIPVVLEQPEDRIADLKQALI